MKTVNKILILLLLVVLMLGAVHANDELTDTSTHEAITDNSPSDINQDIEKEVKNYKKEDNAKIETKTTVSTTKSIIGENLELNAKVTDAKNKKVNEGYVLFKLNGITIKDNKKLTDSTNPLKVNVVNGTAKTTVISDLTMRYAQNLTAVYSGTKTYNASRSNTAKAQILQRNASIIVSSNVNIIKQGQTLTLKAQVYDTTNNQKSTNLIAFEDEYVYFKVNGLTLKNSQSEVLKIKLSNGLATTNYKIPLGLSGVTDAETLTAKNHTILAGFYNKNYQENIRNTSTFQVERSSITININNATIDNKQHQLSLNTSIKDYLGNYISGPNKCIIKINGISLKNGTQPLYFYSTNGVLTIKNTPLPLQDKYESLEVVTQDRLAYKSGRNSTNRFNIIKQNTIITLDSIAKVDYNKNITLTGKITGQANENLNNKTLTVNFNGATTKINTDNKGNFRYTNKTNLVGTNTITVTFGGDASYISSSNKTTFQVIHKPTIIEYTVSDANYSDYTEIEGYLADKDYNELKKTRVIININGETYYTRTDEIGEFHYVYQTKKAGRNNITVSFNGTEYYNPVSKTKTFNVFKLETLIFLDYLPEITSLDDYVTISGEVIDNKDNPLKNVNLTLTVNNQRFYLKTNNYGIFTYNYKTTTEGTNRVEATVSGNENYQTSTDLGRLNVMKTYNITLNFYKDKSDEIIVNTDRFGSFYEYRPDWQWEQGAYVYVEDIYDGIDGQATNLLINATFYFKNSKGNIISRGFTDYSEEVLSHELISGYTPFKVIATYRKKTDNEKSLWYDGYRYNPIAKEWIQVYDPYENEDWGT